MIGGVQFLLRLRISPREGTGDGVCHDMVEQRSWQSSRGADITVSFGYASVMSDPVANLSCF
jgi:hypothetical protein